MDYIDSRCWVLQPEVVSRACTYRRLSLGIFLLGANNYWFLYLPKNYLSLFNSQHLAHFLIKLSNSFIMCMLIKEGNILAPHSPAKINDIFSS